MRIAWNVRVAGSIRTEPLAWNRPADDIGQLRRRLDPSGLARLDDEASHSACVALLAELVNHVRQRPLVRFGDQIRGRGTGRRIHAHIERIVPPKTEPPSRRVELHRRDAEIREHAGDAGDPLASSTRPNSR